MVWNDIYAERDCVDENNRQKVVLLSTAVVVTSGTTINQLNQPLLLTSGTDHFKETFPFFQNASVLTETESRHKTCKEKS